MSSEHIRKYVVADLPESDMEDSLERIGLFSADGLPFPATPKPAFLMVGGGGLGYTHDENSGMWLKPLVPSGGSSSAMYNQEQWLSSNKKWFELPFGIYGVDIKVLHDASAPAPGPKLSAYMWNGYGEPAPVTDQNGLTRASGFIRSMPDTGQDTDQLYVGFNEDPNYKTNLVLIHIIKLG